MSEGPLVWEGPLELCAEGKDRARLESGTLTSTFPSAWSLKPEDWDTIFLVGEKLWEILILILAESGSFGYSETQQHSHGG